MATNYKNSKLYALTNTKASVPASSAGTGTIETQGKNVVGTGTAFLTQAPKGSWIVDLSQDEVRKVVECISDTELALDYAFTTDIPAATTPDIIHERLTSVVEISVIIPLVDGAGTPYTFGEIDGVAFPSGLPYELTKAGRDDSAAIDFVNPIVADATGTLMLVSTLS